MRILAIALLGLSITACNVRLNEEGGLSVNPARDEAPPEAIEPIATQTTSTIQEGVDNSSENIEDDDDDVECSQNIYSSEEWEKAEVTKNNTRMFDENSSDVLRVLQKGDRVDRINVAVYKSCNVWWFVNHVKSGTRGRINEENVQLIVD